MDTTLAGLRRAPTPPVREAVFVVHQAPALAAATARTLDRDPRLRGRSVEFSISPLHPLPTALAGRPANLRYSEAGEILEILDIDTAYVAGGLESLAQTAWHLVWGAIVADRPEIKLHVYTGLVHSGGDADESVFADLRRHDDREIMARVFANLFRYALVPADDPALLEPVWDTAGWIGRRWYGDFRAVDGPLVHVVLDPTIKQ